MKNQNHKIGQRINTQQEACKQADLDWYQCKIDYATAVKRCLQTVTDELTAIAAINHDEHTVIEGMKHKELPSNCASALCIRQGY